MCAKTVVIVALLVAVASGHPTVIDIADLDTMRRLEFDNAIPVDNNGVNQPQDLLMNETSDGYVNSEFDKDDEVSGFLELEWSARGSIESEEEMVRVARSVPRKGTGLAVNSESSESREDNKDNLSEDSGPEESSKESEEKVITQVGAVLGSTVTPNREGLRSSDSPQSDEDSKSSEKRGRVRRWYNGGRWSHSFEDDSDESPECDEHHDHYHGHHDHYHGHHDDSGTWHHDDSGTWHHHSEFDGSSEQNKETHELVYTTKRPFVTTASPSQIPVGITPSISTESTGRINIDPRIGVGQSEVRAKRTAWNGAQFLNDHEKDTRSVKLGWMWDDRKPEVAIPPGEDVLEDRYVRKAGFIGQQAPIVPCGSKFERRDIKGRCVSIFE